MPEELQALLLELEQMKHTSRQDRRQFSQKLTERIRSGDFDDYLFERCGYKELFARLRAIPWAPWIAKIILRVQELNIDLMMWSAK